MIMIGLLGLLVTLIAVAIRSSPRHGGSKLYLAISSVPLLLTTVVPVPFAMASQGPTDWARQTVVTVSRIGIALSFILFTIGAVLTMQAARRGDRSAAKLLVIETALAGIPAGIFTAYAAIFLL